MGLDGMFTRLVRLGQHFCLQSLGHLGQPFQLRVAAPALSNGHLPNPAKPFLPDCMGVIPLDTTLNPTMANVGG